jgi:hypothetical protein
MSSDAELLRDLNVVIGEKENDGDVGYFERLLAPTFSMRRANGRFDDRAQFLAGVAPSPQRRTETPSVTMYGDTCAVVTCIVSTGAEPAVDRVHNVRLFVRADPAATWQLLSWSNARVAEPS